MTQWLLFKTEYLCSITYLITLISKQLYPFTVVAAPAWLQRFYLLRRLCHCLDTHQIYDQSWLKQCDASLKNYFPSCCRHVIFDWILVSPWVLLHWNFCWPDDLWFSVWMCIFPSWHSLLWISPQKQDAYSVLTLQGRYLYFNSFFFFFLRVFWLRIKLCNFFLSAVCKLFWSQHPLKYLLYFYKNSPINLEPRKFFWKSV